MKTRITHTFRPLFWAVLFLGLCHAAVAGAQSGTEMTFTKTVNGAKLKFRTDPFTYYQSSYGYYNNVIVDGFADDANFNGVLHIPATVTYNGTVYNVETINDYAFSGCNNITGVILDRVSTVCSYAFYSCVNMASLTIQSIFYAYDGRLVQYHGLMKESFQGCDALTYVEVPRKADLQYNQGPYAARENYTINPRAFFYCDRLTAFTVSDNDPYEPNAFYTYSGVLFSNNDGISNKVLVAYPEGRTNTSFTVPSVVSELLPYSFYSCCYLKSLTIPERVEILPEGVFENCELLETINLPNSIKRIDFAAFSGCKKLNNVKLPYHLEEIDSYVFTRCTGLTALTAKNPTAPQCGDQAFYNIESQINLTVPVGSDYAGKTPWSRMKSITESDNILLKYGIRVMGTEVTEANFNDVLNDGGSVRFDTHNILTLKNLDVSYSTANVRGIENYGVDDLTINVNGNCNIVASRSQPFYFTKKTQFTGDTLVVGGLAGIVSYEPVALYNSVFVANASSQLFFLPHLTIDGNTSFIGILESSAKPGYIGGLTLGAGCSLVAAEEGHTLTYDSEGWTILDNGEEMAGGSFFTVGLPFPLYFNGLHLSTATNYYTGGLFRVLPGFDGGYILKGRIYGSASNGYPVLKSTEDGLEIDMEGDSYISSSINGVPAISLEGNATFGGTGTLSIYSGYSDGIFISRGKLNIENIDLEIEGATSGIAAKKQGASSYLGSLQLNNVAGTIKSTNSGSHALKNLRTLTIDNCYIINNAFFDTSTHCVDAQELVLSREEPITPTDIKSLNTAQPAEWYDLQGRPVVTPQPGHIYIVRQADGSTQKVKY